MIYLVHWGYMTCRFYSPEEAIQFWADTARIGHLMRVWLEVINEETREGRGQEGRPS